jgi:hypothetical protein
MQRAGDNQGENSQLFMVNFKLQFQGFCQQKSLILFLSPSFILYTHVHVCTHVIPCFEVGYMVLKGPSICLVKFRKECVKWLIAKLMSKIYLVLKIQDICTLLQNPDMKVLVKNN